MLSLPTLPLPDRPGKTPTPRRGESCLPLHDGPPLPAGPPCPGRFFTLHPRFTGRWILDLSPASPALMAREIPVCVHRLSRRWSVNPQGSDVASCEAESLVPGTAGPPAAQASAARLSRLFGNLS